MKMTHAAVLAVTLTAGLAGLAALPACSTGKPGASNTLGSINASLDHDPPAIADAAYVHALVEAYRSVAWERDDLVADPAHAPMPPAELVAGDPELSEYVRQLKRREFAQ